MKQSELMRDIVARPDDFIVDRKSTVHGKGVFAVVDLPAGRLLAYYKGERLSNEEYEKRYSRKTAGSGYALDMETHVLDAANLKYSDWTRYVNDAHGTKHRTNCEFSVGGAIKTKRRIAAGEELFVGYGRGYWKGR